MDALAVLALAVLTRGGPDPGPPPVDPTAAPIEIVIYDDDAARGAEACRIELTYGPAVCRVEPTSAAPDLSQPGWAWDFAPSWAQHMDPRGGQ